MNRLVCILIGYLLGLIQTGYIVGKIKGIDIRNYGSKNAGTTNVLRTMGTKYAIIVFAGDALKCIVAVFVVSALFANNDAGFLMLLKLYTVAGVILGHNYPFYMGFKGGKGIAATAGLIISYIFQFKYGWIPVVVAFFVFFGIFFSTHYVSVGSIMLYVTLLIEIIIFGENGLLNISTLTQRNYLTEYYILMGCLMLMAFWRHRVNIVRLINGEERKTYFGDKPEIDINNRQKGE